MRVTEWDCWSESTVRARKSAYDVDARRLENAVWRLWNMDRHEESPQGRKLTCRSPTTGLAPVVGALDDEVMMDGAFMEKLQGAIGGRIDFATLRFPAARRNCRYDDLPTFPVRPNFAGFDNQLRAASECVVFDGCPEDPYHPSNTPIYQTATFVQPSCSEFGAYDYTRSGNPTRTALEKHAAMLEKAAAAFAFASGMAALHTVLRLLKCGDEILVNEDIYGGMHRILTQDCVNAGVNVVFTDTTNLELVESMITPRTRIIHTESPSNPRMRISDLRALAEIAHRHGVLLSVDSTMMPPVICKPLTLGADIVVHSATKFFSGHADCTGGLVCVRDPELAHRIAFLQNAEGTALAPFECFLFLRGIKTMHLRVKQAQENAECIAAFLLQHPRIKGVFFPGSGGCDVESLRIHRLQALGQGSMISLTTGSVDFSRRFCDACRIFKTTVSFGSVNSLCEMPCTMSHASIPAEKRTIAADLVRLSIGIEDARDLVADLARALEVAAGALPMSEHEANLDSFDSKFEDLPLLPRLPPAPGSRRSEVSTGLPTPSPSPSSPDSATPRQHLSEVEEPERLEAHEAAAAERVRGGTTAVGQRTATLVMGSVVLVGALVMARRAPFLSPACR